jgi:hypothetical protein
VIRGVVRRVPEAFARTRVRATVLVLMVATVGAGCSTSATLDDYVPAAEDLSQTYVEEAQALSFDYQSAVEDGVRAIVEGGAVDPETDAVALVVDETVAYLAVLTDTMGRYLEAFDDLDAPAEVASEHDDYVAAIGVVHASLPGTRSAVEVATQLDEVQVAMTSSGFADGQLRWTASCSALEQAVRDQGTGIDLRCVAPTSSR